MDYKSYCGFAIGASHIVNKQPCEDYALCHAADGCAISIVSDGHGESRAFRASVGAKLACESAKNIFVQYISEADDVLRKIESSKERFFFNLKGHILRTWLDDVEKDYTTHPFTDKEVSGLSEKNKEYMTFSENYIKAYGCTLIAAFVAPTFWFCLQIGDGTCTVCYDDGVSVQPLPGGPGQVANITNSLCQSNAMEKFVYFFEKKSPLGIFVATDGVDESYSPLEISIQLPHFYREVSLPFYDNEKTAQEGLEAKLKRLTSEGSGDDVAIAAAISATSPLVEPKYSHEQLSKLLEKTELEVEGKRASIDNNSKALKQTEREYKSCIDGAEALKKEIERIKRIKFDNESELQEMLKAIKTIKIKMKE